ncbi:hypothetical protein [Solitalea koreensis]|uniref:Uncharacterized protein n=1 Tax=Solitalea koreensis TaxID=543615 RepID=A0A521DK86_9SPHI|nr:hypothetical protein [Solitalea koreensis]SMO72028.1 hypothetical protein SAMN06265350_10767 [Solitalea koreensis]
MKYFLLGLITYGLLISYDGYGQEKKSTSMLASATDDAKKEWNYLAKSTTVIGMPFQSDVTQVTFDGALFTRYAELCFFWGKNNNPVFARQKTFFDGWIPIVEYSWEDAGLKYELEYFADYIDEDVASPVVNFSKIKVTNVAAHAATAMLKAALRHNGGDYRYESDPYSYNEPFSPDWNYEMTSNAVIRNNYFIYGFEQGASRQSVPGVIYKKAFSGRQYHITKRAECCLAVNEKLLQPGQTVEWVFKMPQVPVATAQTALLKKINQASYSLHKAKTIRYWQDLMQNASQFKIPEARVENAYKAGVVHTLLATRNRQGKKYQTDGLPYSDFFLTSVPEMTLLYLSAGMPQILEESIIPDALKQQQENGLYFDRAVAHGKIIPATQGHILYSIAMTALYTRDAAFAQSIFPSIAKGIEFLQTSIDSSRYGLLPPCYAYDAEMITGHYSGQNFFALMGLRSCIGVARLLNKKEDEIRWTTLANKYEQNILKAIDASAKDGYVPTGLYNYLTGQKAREGFDECMTDADWENMILAYPTEILAPTDSRVTATLKRIRKDYAEGIMTYRHGMYLHQYITSNMIQQYLAQGDGFTALKDFYHQLLHSGSTMECFENLVKPWTDRQVAQDCPPPHAWGGSKQALTVRNLLLMEIGGKNGMESKNRELWLFNCLSPEWVGIGKKVEMKNAITEFGKITASFSANAQGANYSFSNQFHTQPAYYRIRIPYFKKLIRFSSDASWQKREADCILLSTDATKLSVVWNDDISAHLHTVENVLMDYRGANKFKGVENGKAIIEAGKPFLLPGEKSNEVRPLSFELIKNTFLYEYNRLAKEKAAKGELLQTVAPPLMLNASQRKQLFESEFKTEKKELANE